MTDMPLSEDMRTCLGFTRNVIDHEEAVRWTGQAKSLESMVDCGADGGLPCRLHDEPCRKHAIEHALYNSLAAEEWQLKHQDAVGLVRELAAAMGAILPNTLGCGWVDSCDCEDPSICGHVHTAHPPAPFRANAIAALAKADAFLGGAK